MVGMTDAEWLADEGYPTPSDLSRTIRLFECQSCQRRAANPPAGNWSCPCGGETVVQEFGPTEYAELRKYGEVKSRV